MREVTRLSKRDARRQPWKNGRGVTRELALWPPGSSFEGGDFDWRISTSSVDADGPFSAFPEFDRILLVTDGEGFVLSHGEAAPRARLRRLEPYLFSGAWPTRAELTQGAAADFNVLVRRGAYRASVEVLELKRRRLREALACTQAFVHVLAGACFARVTDEEEPFSLGPETSLWARGLAASDELDVRGETDNALALLVRITSV